MTDNVIQFPVPVAVELTDDEIDIEAVLEDLRELLDASAEAPLELVGLIAETIEVIEHLDVQVDALEMSYDLLFGLVLKLPQKQMLAIRDGLQAACDKYEEELKQ